MAVLLAHRNNLKHRTRFRCLARTWPPPPNLNPGNPTKRSLSSPATEGVNPDRGRDAYRYAPPTGSHGDDDAPLLTPAAEHATKGRPATSHLYKLRLA